MRVELRGLLCQPLTAMLTWAHLKSQPCGYGLPSENGHAREVSSKHETGLALCSAGEMTDRRTLEGGLGVSAVESDAAFSSPEHASSIPGVLVEDQGLSWSRFSHAVSGTQNSHRLTDGGLLLNGSVRHVTLFSGVMLWTDLVETIQSPLQLSCRGSCRRVIQMVLMIKAILQS